MAAPRQSPGLGDRLPDHQPDGKPQTTAAEPQCARIEKKLQQAPAIAVPAITVDGAFDPFTPAGNGSSYREKFVGKYDHRVLNVGHNVPQEDPHGFVQAVIDADRL